MGTDLVVGRKRVPKPAAGTMAVRNGLLVGLFMVRELIGRPYNEAVTSLGESYESKTSWRRALLGQRRAGSEITRSAENEALISAVLAWIGDGRITTVCAYVPVDGEPGSLELLDGVRAAGSRVLLPIVVGAEPLDWAEYVGPDSLRPARFGLLEPDGERLGSGAIGEADAILVPALAVDHHGVRLGRGAGHYDRSLVLAAPGADMIAVVRDDEFVARLPGEEHDVRMSAVVTPERGVLRLPV